jgi:hypothetical protein
VDMTYLCGGVCVCEEFGEGRDGETEDMNIFYHHHHHH